MPSSGTLRPPLVMRSLPRHPCARKLEWHDASVDLRPGEKVLFEGRPAWRALLSFYLTGALIAAVIGVLVGGPIGSTGTGVGAGVAILVLVLVVGYLRRLFTKYLITNQR